MENTEKLPEDFKKKWVEALRSGDYKQGKGKLISEDRGETRYCCLGVACKINGYTNSEMQGYATISRRAFGRMPALLMDYTLSNVPLRLIFMNDGRGDRPHNFNEIADYIEQNL